MGKSASDAVLDALIDKIATGTNVTVCNAEPATLLQAESTFKLADVTVTAGAGNGDWVKTDSPASGRRLRLLRQTTITIDTTGDASHLAVTDGAILLFVTTLETVTTLTSGGDTVTIEELIIDSNDPT